MREPRLPLVAGVVPGVGPRPLGHLDQVVPLLLVLGRGQLGDAAETSRPLPFPEQRVPFLVHFRRVRHREHGEVVPVWHLVHGTDLVVAVVFSAVAPFPRVVVRTVVFKVARRHLVPRVLVSVGLPVRFRDVYLRHRVRVVLYRTFLAVPDPTPPGLPDGVVWPRAMSNIPKPKKVYVIGGPNHHIV